MAYEILGDFTRSVVEARNGFKAGTTAASNASGSASAGNVNSGSGFDADYMKYFENMSKGSRAAREANAKFKNPEPRNITAPKGGWAKSVNLQAQEQQLDPGNSFIAVLEEERDNAMDQIASLFSLAGAEEKGAKRESGFYSQMGTWALKTRQAGQIRGRS